MKNKEFYAYCRDNRGKEPSLAKREAMVDVYNYMRECGMKREDVKRYIERMLAESAGRHYDIEAYQWLLNVFEGPSLEVSKEETAGQLRLF